MNNNVHHPHRLAVVGLPLPALAPLTATPTALYAAVSPIDARGRIADSSPVRIAGLAPNDTVTITVNPHQGHRIILVTRTGTDTITRQGHLRIPAPIRHRCTITTGTRLLVITTPGTGTLTIHTMETLTEILQQEKTSNSYG